ncbi:MAG: hypothetical protein ACQEUT_11525 [Bacillota bacterium]
MSITITKLSYDEIDNLLQPSDKDLYKDIKWRFVSEEEIELLLKNN